MKQLKLMIVAMILGTTSVTAAGRPNSPDSVVTIVNAEYVPIPNDYAASMSGRKSVIDTGYQFRYYVELLTDKKYVDMAFFYYFPDELLPKRTPAEEKVISTMVLHY